MADKRDLGRTAEHRMLLLGGMGGFLVVALSVPDAFDGAGEVFGLAYLAVILIHIGLFYRWATPERRKGIVILALVNIPFALAVVAGGFAGGTAQWIVWASAGLVPWKLPLPAAKYPMSHDCARPPRPSSSSCRSRAPSSRSLRPMSC